MRLVGSVLLLIVPIAFAAADAAEVTAQADSLHDQGSFAEARSLVLEAVAAAPGGEQAELYWRASRETLELGDAAEKEGKPLADLLAAYTEGEGYADKAIAADPRNDLGYYWKSANTGRWGQVKGVVNALFKAQPMKDLLIKVLSLNAERSDAYYVLGELYRELPGWPVSFGNLEAAASLGRKAVEMRQAQVQNGSETYLVYNFYTELAKTLYKRNWSAGARTAGQKSLAAKLASASSPLDKGCLYDATTTLKETSDREEARGLLRWVVAELEGKPDLTAPEKKDLQKARDVLKGW